MIKRRPTETEVIIYLGIENVDNLIASFKTSPFACDDEDLEEYILRVVANISFMQDECAGEYLVQIDGEYHNVCLDPENNEKITLEWIEPKGV